jgi:hypothetical protein
MMQANTRPIQSVKRVLIVAFLFLLNATAAFLLSPSATSRLHLTLMADESSSDNDDSTITLGLTSDDDQNKAFLQAILKHETLRMLGVTLESVNMSNDKFADQVDVVDAACFASSKAVDEWLENVDAVIDEVIDEDEKTNGDVVAVCLSKDIANTCLQSKRWESRNIYYPKGENDDMGLWVASAVQAIGDINERRFWGGGW